MKVVFSRKGFDSAAGGCPSPIKNGLLVSLPIPTGPYPTSIRYCDLNGEYAELVEDLTQIPASSGCHLDPDISESVLERLDGWRGTFGQSDGQQSHLENHNVSIGDVFLFFGLFQPIVRHAKWQFEGLKHHRIFGWLQVGEIIDLGPDGSHALTNKPWLVDHPHVRPGWNRKNVVYVAADKLMLPGLQADKTGSGVFRRGYKLSAEGCNLSVWRIPDWLNPKTGGVGMTFHPKQERWFADGRVQTVGRGQDFVANIDGRVDAEAWLANFFNEHQ